ncbi:MAG: hypothetical protein Q8910_04225 [Bacteroidota bacterium]|nr:hypothetical protein [Bacteroidota bacterium]
MSKVLNGEVEGIRHAKDLVELIKADLLLLGEATDRTENLSELEQTKVARIQEEIDIEDPAVLALVDKLTQALNGVNDDADN